MNKVCTKCKTEKSVELFSKSKKHSSGYKSACKACLNAQEKVAYDKNPNKRKDYHKQFYQEHKDVYHKRYKKGISDPKKKEIRLEYNREWYYKNLEYYREYSLNWRINNPDKHCAKSNRYRALKLNATPLWLTEEQHAQINAFYTEASKLTKESDIIYHVDHIYPLKGKNSCGLHVPWNLQILTSTENIKKSNKIKELQ